MLPVWNIYEIECGTKDAVTQRTGKSALLCVMPALLSAVSEQSYTAVGKGLRSLKNAWCQ